MGEELLDLSLGESKHVVLHGLFEFKFIEGHGVVVIHDSKLLSKSDDSTSTSSLKLLSEFFEESVSSLGTLGWGSSNLSSKNFRGKLFIIKSATSIFVIQSIKSLQILINNK